MEGTRGEEVEPVQGGSIGGLDESMAGSGVGEDEGGSIGDLGEDEKDKHETYGPLLVKRHHKKDGRTLLLYALSEREGP